MRLRRCAIMLCALWEITGLARLGLDQAIAQEVVPLPPVIDSAPLESTAACPAFSGATASTVRITLEDAKARALSNNKSIALARLNIDGKHFATSAATKDYFPKVLGNVTYFHFDNPLGTVLTTCAGNTFSVNVINQDAALSTAMVAQPITKLIAVNANVQLNRADENIAKAKLDEGSKELLTGVTQAYYALSGAQHMQAAMQLQGTVLEQAVAANPTPEARIGLVELRQGMLQVQAQIQELNDQLDDLLDFPPGTVLELVDPVPPVPPVASPDQAAQMALAANPEICEAKQTIAKAEAGLKVARMDYYPDVNIVGGYANQTGASYIQDNFTYLGLTASYTFWEWGKKNDVIHERETDVALAHQNLQVVSDKVQLEARKSYGAFEQALCAYRLAGELAQAYLDAEQSAKDPVALANAKGATAKAQLEYMKDEIAYRVAHAQLMGAIGNQ